MVEPPIGFAFMAVMEFFLQYFQIMPTLIAAMVLSLRPVLIPLGFPMATKKSDCVCDENSKGEKQNREM
jgi:hypothetical protein